MQPISLENNLDLALEQSIAEDCENHLSVFVREAWPHVDTVPYVHGRHIDMMSEYCEAFIGGEIPRLLINIPPGHMKSIECSVMLNAWTWTKKERASKRFVGLSYKADLAFRDADKVRDLIRSEWYQRRWGTRIGGLREESFTLKKGRDRVSRFTNDQGGYRFSGPVSAVMGEGGDFIIFDDPHNVEKAESPDVLAKTVDQVNLALPTRVRSVNGGVLLIMQRLRENDMSGDWIARSSDLVHLCLPARYEKKHPFVTVPITLKKSGRQLPGDWRTEERELLFPELFNDERLDAALEFLGAYGEAGQMQQRPSPREGGMFQKQDFQIIDRMPQTKRIGRPVRGWDIAATQDAGKYTAGVRMSLWRASNDPKDRAFIVVIEHVLRGRWRSYIRDQNMAKQAEVDGRQTIQDVPQDPGAAGKVQASGMVANLADGASKIVKSLESGDKIDRADPLSSQAQASNVYLLRGDWNQDYIDEACLFPNGLYTDQIDASSRAYANLQRQKGKRKPPPPRAAELIEG